MTDNTFVWAGIDAGADSSRLSIIDEQLAAVLDVTLASNAEVIGEALRPYAAIRNIAIEAQSASQHIVRGLRRAGHPVTIYQAAQVSRYLGVRRNKTDDNDARGLAELARLGHPAMRAVHLKSPEIQRMRTKLAFRQRLTFHRVACEGMIRSLIRMHGGSLKKSQSARAIARNVSEAIEAIDPDGAAHLAQDVLPLLDLAVRLRQHLASVDRDLQAWAEAHPVCSRFLAIPGVGPLCAVSFFTAIEDPDRFVRAGDVGPYLGLTPRVLQSGISLRHGRISKLGSKLTRSHLVNAATVSFAGRIKDHPLKIWGLRLAERSCVGKARVAVARRMAVIMLALWKHGTAYDEALAAPRSHG